MTKKNKTLTKTAIAGAIAICLTSGTAFAINQDGLSYKTSGQYVMGENYNAGYDNVNAFTARSGDVSRQTGIICDLSAPYFIENYPDQTYDLTY